MNRRDFLATTAAGLTLTVTRTPRSAPPPPRILVGNVLAQRTFAIEAAAWYRACPAAPHRPSWTSVIWDPYDLEPWPFGRRAVILGPDDTIQSVFGWTREELTAAPALGSGSWEPAELVAYLAHAGPPVELSVLDGDDPAQRLARRLVEATTGASLNVVRHLPPRVPSGHASRSQHRTPLTGLVRLEFYVSPGRSPKGMLGKGKLTRSW